MRFILTLSLFYSLVASSVLAQPSGFSFLETLQSGEGRLDLINVIKTLPNGDFIVGGEFRGTKDFDPGQARVIRSTRSTSTTNPFIARYSPSGELIWVRHLRTGSGSELRSLDLDNAGNVYALGSFNDVFYPDESDLTQVLVDNPEPNADLWVASFTQDGNFRWAEGIGGDAVDSGTALVVNNNSLVICGVFGQTVDIDPGAGVFEVSTDGQGGQLTFVASYNKDSMSFEWGFQIGGVVFFDLINAIDRDDAGNLYITGAFRQAKDFDPSPDSEFILVSDGSNDDVFVASYTSTGDFRWARRAGDGGADFGRGIDWSNGTVYVTGEFRFTSVFEGDTNTETLVAAGNQDAFIASYNAANGELIDVFGIGSTGNDSGQTIERVGDQLLVTGNYAATVNFNPNGAQTDFTATSLNGFLASYDVSTSELNWMSDVQSAGVSYTTDLVAANGSIFAVGRFTNTTDFDPGAGEAIIVPIQNNDTDFFLAEYTESTGAFNAVYTGEDQLGGNDDVRGMATLSTGGVVACGVFEGRLFLQNDEVLNTVENGGFIVRYGEGGELLATARLQGSVSAFVTDIAVDAQDNVYVTAYYTGDGSFLHTGGELSLAPNANQSRMLLLKLNANLELLWAKEYSGTLLNVASALTVNNDRVVFTGFFRGDLTVAPGEVLSSNGNQDGFVISVLPDGTHEWGFNFGSTSLDSGLKVTFDADGNVLLAALIRFTVNMDPSGAADPLAGSGSNTLVLASYTPAGSYQWANLQSTGMNARSLVQVDDQRFAVFGTFQNTATLGSPNVNQSLTSLGSTDVYLGVFNNNGDLDAAYAVATGSSNEEAGALVFDGGAFHFTGQIRLGGTVNAGGMAMLQWDPMAFNGFYASLTLAGEWIEGFLLADEEGGTQPTSIAASMGEIYLGGNFTGRFGEEWAFASSDAFVGRLGAAPDPPCAGDFDNDGIVAAPDLLILLAEFGCSSNCPSDLNGDDQTNVSDVLVFLSLFGSSCN